MARVEFYQGATLLATVTTAPYTYTWSNVAAGSYALTAQAFDNQGAGTTSASVTITVNAAPTVALTSPANNAVFAAPATITLSANATDADGAIAKVEFYQGTTLIGTATGAPYSISWANVAAGGYSLTAVATDDRGASTTSAAVAINVNALPTVNLTSPANNATFTAPASITLAADATDSDCTVAKVEFYAGSTLITTLTSAPYAFTWTNVVAGNYTLTARATDNLGATTTSAPVSITVTVPVNVAPVVSMTSPANGATFSAPADIPLAANASDSDGTIARVEFYTGSTLITTLTAPPYSVLWTGVPVGSYTLTAKATDNQGATTTSAPVTVTVNAAVASTLYYIHTDHLNTPRLITNQVGQTVWRYDNNDPFGGNVPDENPSGLGAFTFNLRFPNTYADKETGLLQNWHRELDPAIGGYLQPEPIGLAGDINLYRYARSNPLSYYDPNGLQAAPAPGLPIPLPPVFIPGTPANQAFVGSVNQLIKKIKELCESDDSQDCEKASRWQLRAAGITNEHEFKQDYVGKQGVSRYDICACKDGSIVIKQVGMCGRSGPSIPTSNRWK